ncbi:unannotated protein [freshwater metagenome]|uniref:Unannotated protein n=1 Tax=freshwater metagenome TaxID=449393 RepID=A0A6J5Z814_9ZZZZ
MVVYALGVARAGTELLINSADRLEVVAHAADADEAGRRALGHQPDVVVIGPNQSFGDALHTQVQIVEAVREASPRSKVLLMSLTGDDVAAITEGVAAGADGSIAIGSSATEFLSAVVGVAEGRGQISADVTKRIIEGASARDRSALAERDLEILCGVALGYTSGEIAEHLNLSPRTIEGRRIEIYNALEIESRPELVAWAVAHEIFFSPVGYYASRD